MSRTKPKPPLLATPCPFPGCAAELRAVLYPQAMTVRGYHGEDGLIDMQITATKPDETPDAATLDVLQRTAMTLWGREMGHAVAEWHAERGDR